VRISCRPRGAGRGAAPPVGEPVRGQVAREAHLDAVLQVEQFRAIAFAAAVERAGHRVEPGRESLLAPVADAGVEGLAFVEAVLQSAAKDSAWVKPASR